MDIWVPLKKKIKIKNNKALDQTERDRERIGKERFFNFFSLSFLSQIYRNLTVGIRRAKNEKCSTR